MLMELPQERLLRSHGYSMRSFAMLERRVNRWKRKGIDLVHAPSHIKAKASIVDAIHGIGK